jgi:hypothetical protein
MSDNLTRYCAIREALTRLLPQKPAGNLARHLLTLAALISGIVGSRRTSLSAIASKIPTGGSPKGGGRESRIKRFSRWIANDRIDADTYYLPFVRALLEGLPPGPLVLVMDGSLIGRGCQALVISVLYESPHGSRALPLVWSVVTGGKGHLSEQMHQGLVRRVAPLIPPGREVVFLGDGEYNGVGLLGLLTQQGWKFACRVGRNTKLCEDDEWFSLSFLPVTPGDRVELSDVLFTEHGFGPVLVTAQWREGDDGPLYLVSNFDFFHEATAWYAKRFLIETFFSDQKSRGFYLCHSHLSDPMRLSRLMIATCLAYLWMVCLGAEVRRRGWQGAVHRKGRCDLSLFQIGLVWNDHALNEGLPLLVPLTPPSQPSGNCVR